MLPPLQGPQPGPPRLLQGQPMGLRGHNPLQGYALFWVGCILVPRELPSDSQKVPAFKKTEDFVGLCDIVTI